MHIANFLKWPFVCCTVCLVNVVSNPVLKFLACFYIQVVDLNYGMGSDNPINHVRFYSKGNLNQAVMVRKNQVGIVSPHSVLYLSFLNYSYQSYQILPQGSNLNETVMVR